MTLEEAMYERHSVRDYIEEPLAQELIDQLNERIRLFNSVSSLNLQLVVNEPKAFKGLNSYGKFHGVQNYIVMAGRKNDDLDFNIGYYGEELVLYAQTLGLNTCWVGMTYKNRKDAFTLRKDDKIRCVIAIGYGKTQGVRHRIKTVEQVSNASDKTPDWFRRSVEAALLAPTAMNQQKFYFEYRGIEEETGRHVVSGRPKFSLFGYTQIDLGIAKKHFEIATEPGFYCWDE